MRNEVAYELGDIRAYIARKLATVYDYESLLDYVVVMLNKNLPYHEYVSLPGQYAEDKARIIVDEMILKRVTP